MAEPRMQNLPCALFPAAYNRDRTIMSMTPERRRRVEELSHAAVARDARARALFLGDACAGNELRRDVEWLLAQPASEETPGEPAVGEVARS